MRRCPRPRRLGRRLRPSFVFPNVTKAGLGIGGQHGDRALIQSGKAVGCDSTSGASFGLQAGGQTTDGYAMFFTNAKALQQLDVAKGFEVGVGPTVAVMDQGKAKSTTTTTMNDDIYAVIFSQKGLMGGLGLNIRKIDPD
jgi:lipid-binding SYLF domain-containing protein